MKKFLSSPKRVRQMLSLALALLSTLSSQLSTFGQGSLTPPGPPGATMKTLAQIEPRTPISSLPVALSEPGSYYLTTNLTYTGGNGITVLATNVTIDLNGFALQGAGTNSTAFGINSSAPGLVVRNGTIAGWYYGVSSGGPNNKFENVLFSSGPTYSFGLYLGARGGTVLGCNFESCGAGIFSEAYGSTILDCTVSGSLAPTTAGIVLIAGGGTISRCTVSAGQGNGISAGISSTISHCAAYGNKGAAGIYAAQSVIIGCAADYNATNGIQGTLSSTISDCTAGFNNASGVNAQENCAIKGCTAYNNGVGISVADSCTIAGCDSAYNGLSGISARNGCTITGCNAAANRSVGISLGDDTVVKDCTVRGNTNAGINAGNHLTASGCTLASNGGAGLSGGFVCKVADCVAVLNGGFGISLGLHGQVTGCHLNANTSGGVLVAGDSLVKDNMIDFHQTATSTPGISVTGSGNRIEGNNITRAGHGLDVSSTGNLVLHNSVSASTGVNYNIVAGNSVGPVVQPPPSGAISGSTGGAGVGSTDPSANYSY